MSIVVRKHYDFPNMFEYMLFSFLKISEGRPEGPDPDRQVEDMQGEHFHLISEEGSGLFRDRLTT